jgi:citrate lyase subunit beta/citryl-CoA lyase
LPDAVVVRPRRSALFMPGSNGRALEKARTLPCDVVILDLEDAVAPDAKADARARVLGALAAGGSGRRERVVRVNGLDTPWGHADLTAAATSGADAILVPKVESGDMVRRVAAILAGAGAPETQSLWVMLESPLAMLDARDIAAAHPRLGALVMGTSDLAKDLHARQSRGREALVTGLGLCLLAARAHGLVALDGVHADIADNDGLDAACRQGALLGFDGKTLVHPGQIDAANRAFGPDPAEVERARRIIAAHAAAVAAGRGVTTVDGRMIEALHVAEARRVVALADAVAAAEGRSTEAPGVLK